MDQSEDLNKEISILQSLEKIRNATMDMESSDELKKVVGILNDEISNFHLAEWGCNIQIMHDLREEIEIWLSGAENKIFDQSFFFRGEGHPVIKLQWENWRNKTTSYNISLSGKKKNSYDTYLFEYTDFAHFPDVLKDQIRSQSQVHFSFARMKYGNLVSINESGVLSNDQNDLLGRYAKVFEQAYTRFLDFKKLEEQAIESRIEASLERIRSAALSMQDSQDMLNACKVISDEMQSHGVENIRNIQTFIFHPLEKSYRNYQYYTHYAESAVEVIEYEKNDVIQQMVSEIKDSEGTFYSNSMSGKRLKDFIANRKENNEFNDSMLDKVDKVDYHFYAIENGALGFTSYGKNGPNDLAIFKRVCKAFDLVYQRFRDIERAKTQAREAQIEAALERVRAVSMSMQHSNHLMKVVEVLQDQLDALGLSKEAISIALCHEDKNEIEFWFTDVREYEHFKSYSIKGRKNHYVRKMWSFWKDQERGNIHLWGDRKRKYDTYLLTETDFKDAPKGLGEAMRQNNEVWFTLAPMKYGFLEAVDHHPLSDEKVEILNRFARVFDQAYTRFLDLEKAEAQAREAQIETALERVRAATMAMHHSDDLCDAASVLFRQIESLELKPLASAFIIMDEENKMGEVFISADGSVIPDSFFLPYYGEKAQDLIYESWESDESHTIIDLTGMDLDRHLGFIRDNMPVNDFLEASGDVKPDRLALHILHFKQGFLGINYDEPKEDAIPILRRFAKVFEQTYTRYLDLQKAEAQVQEAQIEAALERVRSASMAMHQSEELSQVVSVLFEQFKSLDLPISSSWIGVLDDTEENMEMWFTGLDETIIIPQKFLLPLKGNKELERIVKSWKSEEESFKHTFKGEEARGWIKQLYEITENQAFAYSESIDLVENIFGFHQYGNVGISSQVPIPEEAHHILLRFTMVFEQTYTRFLDLQKAEAQAREAQIEAALERVRARMMAMHNSTDIADTVLTFFSELTGLGLDPSIRCGVGILSESEEMKLWTASSGKNDAIALHSGYLDMTVHPLLRGVKESWKSKKSSFSYTLEGKDTKAYFRAINNAKDYPVKIDLRKLSAIVFQRTFIFNDGVLYVFSETVLSEDIVNIFQRFAKVFGQAYIRYKDLVNAEARAREAQVEVALERVRAASMAMHESKEFPPIAQILSEQIEFLGIPIFGIGINIISDDGHSYVLYFADNSPDGESTELIITRKLYVKDFWLAIEVVSRLQKGENEFTLTVEGDKLQLWLDWVKSSLSKDRSERLESLRIEKLFVSTFQFHDLCNIIFSSVEELSEFQWDACKRMAQTYGMSYRRYLDLQKAEEQARESQIEAAMERVRAASMAMHKSEDIAVVGNVLYKELISLGITQSATCGFVIIDEKDQVQHLYGSSAGKSFLEYFELPLLGDTILKNRYEAWKRKEPVFQQVLGGNQLKEHLEVVMPMENLTEEIRLSQLEMPDPTNFYFGNFSQGYLQVIADDALRNEQVELIPRFAKVFQQTYTRFLDLKKAEAQARESQIEAALERVRASGMAMHHTDEFSDVAVVLFDQLRSLGVDSQWCWFAIVNDKEAYTDIWYTEYGGKFNPTPSRQSFKDPEATGFVKAWRKKEPFYTYQLKGKSLTRYIDILGTDPEFKKTSSYRIMMDNIKGCLKINHSFFKYGALGFSTFIQCDVDILPLLGRFAKTFEQTYTRFLDLQKAEAQAREAQIEAALERVRAQSLAMHHTSELQQVINTVGVEFQKLNINNSGGVFISINEDIKDRIICWGSGGTAEYMEKVDIPAFNQPIYTDIVRSIKKGPGFVKESFSNEEKIQFFKHMFKYPPYTLTTKEHRQKFLEKPGGYSRSCIISKYTTLFMINHEGYVFTHDENDILKRFGRVFEQSYTRFLDLQRAEAQAREAQIEAALERIRSASMAMHKSEEIRNVANVTFQQLKDLNIQADICLIDIFKTGTNDLFLWGATSEQLYEQGFYVPKFNHIYFRTLAKAKSHDEDLFSFSFNKSQTEKWHDHLLNKTEIGNNIRPNRKKSVLKATSIHGLEAIQKHHGIIIYNFSKHSYNDQEGEVLLRTSQVFEQAYVRFLDLQRAEAQVREAQIEAALERVRARTMAMHQSSELKEASSVLFQEIKNLGIKAESSWLWLIDLSKDLLEIWVTHENKIADPVIVDPSDLWTFQAELDAWKNNEPYLKLAFPKEDAKKAIKKIFKIKLTDNRDASHLHLLQSRHKFGFLGMSSWDEASNEMLDVAQRFSKVFEQTYTRFLDLKKAEKQARESLIEAALERVRAASLAMHTSQELKDVVEVTFNQLLSLKLPIDGCQIQIIEKESRDFHFWSATPEMIYPVRLNIPYIEHPIFRNFWEARKQGDDFISFELSKKDTIDFYDHALKHSELGKTIIKDRIRAIQSIEYGHSSSWSIQKNTGLFIFNFNKHVYNQDENSVVQRFAIVFEQAYTRFLDLKSAEERAREAEVEAALERVRAKAMAMHTSEDLSETVSLLLNELEGLNIQAVRCGLARIFEKSKTGRLYVAKKTEDGHQMELVGTVVLEGHPVFVEIHKSFKNKEPYLPLLKGRLMTSYYKKLNQFIKVERPPKGSVQYGYFDWYNDAGLYAWSEKPFTEETQAIYKKFTAVLGLTFNRYNDLEDAEARAAEAKKDASLDRVRGEIASMRTSEDLNRITPVIWRELISLDVPFIRCGVFIVDDENEEVQAYLSTPDGQAIGVLHLPFDINTQTTNTVAFWRKKEVYQEHWDKATFLDWSRSMVEMGQIKDAASYQGSGKVPESLHLHFVPFRQGMLYVGNTDPLSDEEIETVSTLAEAFSIAYARYEDFDRLEKAKSNLEKTLNDLKATQTQLIQSEKMASLGELTAGIAHEIQNPLNFVNNFSEVSHEIIDEAIEELEAGDQEEAQAILQDLKSNLEKIAHHGHRASGIVKSMLDHSRASSGDKVPTDINALCDEYLRLAYHGMRAKNRSFNAAIETNFDNTLPKIEVIPQDIGRVLLNLINNAFQAVQEKSVKGLQALSEKVSLSTKNLGDKIQITVKDNGPGIPDEIKDKIFQPFFTTKPTGQGTGLGLSLSYDIIKAHGGELKLETTEEEETEFKITLPIV